MDEQELDLITEVFGQYMEVDDDDDSDTMYLPAERLEDAISALGIDPKHTNVVKKTIDPSSTGRIKFEPFAEVMTIQLQNRTSGDAQEAFRLFTKGEAIKIDDLRRISKSAVKDNATDEQLYEMLSLAKGSDTMVKLEDFERIMKDANAL